MKMPSYRYKNSHYRDKMALRLTYLYNGNPHTWTERLTSFIMMRGPAELIGPGLLHAKFCMMLCVPKCLLVFRCFWISWEQGLNLISKLFIGTPSHVNDGTRWLAKPHSPTHARIFFFSMISSIYPTILHFFQNNRVWQYIGCGNTCILTMAFTKHITLQIDDSQSS